MANNLAFDDVARNLLVFLKGQVPSLQNKTNKDEIMRQIQSIVFTLRSTIVQLEGATFEGGNGGQDTTELENTIEDLKKENAKLEESLMVERSAVKDLKNQLTDIRDSMDCFDDEKFNMQDVLHKQKIDNERLRKENEKFRTEYDKIKTEFYNLQAKFDTTTTVPKVDESVVIKLKAELTELESTLSESQTKEASLKQALQNKEIEVSKAKDALMEALANHANLQNQLQSFELVKHENQNLKKQVVDLQNDLKLLPSKEEYQNNISSMTTKLKFLQDSLFESQTELKKAQDQLSAENPNGIAKEKAVLEQKVTSLEATLRNVIAAREADAAKAKNNFIFNPDECIFLFQTLTSTVKRLQESLENKDVYLRSKESIAILEKAKAISKIQTIGQQLDSRVHKVTKAFRADFLPDEMVIHEESAGFVSGQKLIQKAVVWIAKSKFVCTECGKVSKPHELFCPQCGYELTAADGTTKRDMPPFPTTLEVNLPLLDELMKQGNVKASTQLMAIISKVSPNNPEVVKKQAILSRVDPNFSMYPTY